MKKNKTDNRYQQTDSESTQKLVDNVNKRKFNPNNPLESESRKNRSEQDAKQRIHSLAPQSKTNSMIANNSNPDGTGMEENY